MDDATETLSSPPAAGEVLVDSVGPLPTPPAQSPVPGRPPKSRDRVVVLGRTQAGKTIFLSALYCRLWREPSDISIKAVDGRTHKSCIDVFETLREGRWPSSTVGSRYLDFEVTWRGEARPLVSLDYPGEVFRKAFIENSQSPDVEELLEHIDRAAGVICLLDPAIVVGSDLRVAMDDDFGMVKAIDRIRSWPDGERVPVAIVLTKYDVRKAMVEADGGPAGFVRKHYRALACSCPNARVFAASAVQVSAGPEGPEILQDFRPTGIIPPLRFVLHSLRQSEQRADAERKMTLAREWNQKALDQEVRDRRTAIWFWTVASLGFLAIMLASGWFAYTASVG